MSLRNVSVRLIVVFVVCIIVLFAARFGSVSEAQVQQRPVPKILAPDVSDTKVVKPEGSTPSATSSVSSMYFSAIPTGSTGPDLFVLPTASTPQAIPVRTDPSASFGSNAGQGGGFRELNNNLYFFADTAGEFGALFQLSTTNVKTQITGVDSTGVDAHFTFFDGGLFFRALTSAGDELVRLNPNGTLTIIDINPGAGSNSFPGADGGFGVFHNSLYFAATTAATGDDLYRLDAGSTTPVSIEINPGGGSSFAGEDSGYFVFNDNLYFNAFVAADGQDELMRMSFGGSPVPVRTAGNVIIPHESGVTSSFQQFAGSLYTDAMNPTGSDTLVKIDATGVATPIQYLGSDLNSAGSLGGFVQFGTNLYFTANTPTTNYDLFKIDAAGTVTPLNRTNSGSFGAFDGNLAGGFVVYNGAFYFDAYNTGGDAFYKLDSLGNVTTVLDNNTTQAGVSGGYTIFNGNLYFGAFDINDGNELFQIDTTGTLTHFNINAGAGNSYPGNPGGFVVFPALAPTAAGVSVGGRVLTASGSGLRNSSVILTDSHANSKTALSSSFGYYHFDNVRSGETYVIGVSSKRYRFPTQAVNVTDNLTDLNFVAEP